MKLWHIASGELHDIALARLLIIDEGVPRGTAIDNGHVQGEHFGQGAWQGLFLKWGQPNSWMMLDGLFHAKSYKRYDLRVPTF